jgi:hypothetical protein
MNIADDSANYHRAKGGTTMKPPLALETVTGTITIQPGNSGS